MWTAWWTPSTRRGRCSGCSPGVTGRSGAGVVPCTRARNPGPLSDLPDFAHDIHGESHSRRERALAQLAARQHGVVAYSQLVRLGFGRGAIEHRLAVGRLHRIHRSVYAVGHSIIGTRGCWMAAVLACGPGAVLSHRDAGHLWGVRQSARTEIDVTAYTGRHGNRSGITLHRVRKLHPDDRTQSDGIPVTSVSRTLLDLAGVLNPRQLERALDEAERLRLFDLRAVERLLERSRGRRGVRRLSEVLALRRLPLDTRLELERRFVEFCRDAGVPAPAVNAVIEGYTVDAVWPAARLVVELDSYAFHHTRKSFETDRARDAALQVAGFRVLRLTHRRLEAEPAEIARELRSLLTAAALG